jgi:hypothetical protein
VIAHGPLFETPTYRWLPAQSSAKSRYVIALFEAPRDFTGVAAVEFSRGSLLVHEASSARSLRVPAKSFL